MLPEYFSVDVVMERVALAQPLGERAMAARARSMPSGPEARRAAAAAERIDDTPERTRWRFAGLRDRAASDRGGRLLPQPDSPRRRVVFVMWRMREDGVAAGRRAVIVTLSYNEAGRLMDGGEQVDPVPLRRADPRLARRVRRRALQARAQEEGKRNDPFERRRVRARRGDRRHERPTTAERSSLSRWSRRKHEAAREPRRRAAPAQRRRAAPSCGRRAGAPAPPRRAAAPPLPPVESLTFDSDFTPFLRPKVDEARKRAALRSSSAIRTST